MTNQEIFDKIAIHLLRQNAKSVDFNLGSSADLSCAYRGENGLMCAIGCLIPDDKYSRNMEGRVVWANPIASMLCLVYGEINFSLLDDLQSCHDQEEVSDWRKELESIAHNYNLNTAVLA